MATTKRVMVTVGTRPEAVKLAPLIRAMQDDPRFDCCVVATGQHKEMLYQILDWFHIEPDHRMDVMAPKQPLAFLSGKLLNGLHTIMEKERPDIVMVQGDTTSTFMAALTAYYGYDYYVRNEQEAGRRKIEIAHIEAGLRTYDNYAPFPEEANRRLVGHLATYHFAPTYTAAEALYDENITANVYVTGNTVIDALFETQKLLAAKPRQPLPQLAKDQPMVLITGHRRESYGEGFEHICAAIKQLATQYPDHAFVYPVHLNQHVQEPVNRYLSNIPNVHLIAPLDYPDFIAAMQRAKIVLTDSGGVQEEAPSLGKPVLVMRELTERPDAVLAGTAKLVGTVTEKIVAGVQELLDDDAAYTRMSQANNPYGDGHATKRILNILAGEKAEDNTFTNSIAA